MGIADTFGLDTSGTWTRRILRNLLITRHLKWWRRGESEYSRVLKTRKLLISRPAKNAQYYEIAGNWNVSGTWFFWPPEKFSEKDFTFRGPNFPEPRFRIAFEPTALPFSSDRRSGMPANDGILDGGETQTLREAAPLPFFTPGATLETSGNPYVARRQLFSAAPCCAAGHDAQQRSERHSADTWAQRRRRQTMVSPQRQ